MPNISDFSQSKPEQCWKLMVLFGLSKRRSSDQWRRQSYIGPQTWASRRPRLYFQGKFQWNLENRVFMYDEAGPKIKGNERSREAMHLAWSFWKSDLNLDLFDRCDAEGKIQFGFKKISLEHEKRSEMWQAYAGIRIWFEKSLQFW